jgi:hypothetical protein
MKLPARMAAPSSRSARRAREGHEKKGPPIARQALRSQKLWKALESNQVGCALLAAAIFFEFVTNALLFIERAHASGFNRRNVDERVATAIIGLDETIALVGVEKFYSTFDHGITFLMHRTANRSG